MEKERLNKIPINVNAILNITSIVFEHKKINDRIKALKQNGYSVVEKRISNFDTKLLNILKNGHSDYYIQISTQDLDYTDTFSRKVHFVRLNKY